MHYPRPVIGQQTAHNRSSNSVDMEHLDIGDHERKENGDLKEFPSHKWDISRMSFDGKGPM